MYKELNLIKFQEYLRFCLNNFFTLKYWKKLMKTAINGYEKDNNTFTRVICIIIKRINIRI
jgi:hypothetical protein